MSNFKIYSPTRLPKFNIKKVIRPIVFTNLPGYLISLINDCYVSYNFSFTTTTNMLNAQLFLEISTDNHNWTILNQLGLITPSAPSVNVINNITGFIPQENYVRLRGQVDVNTSITYIDGTEYNIN